MQFRFKHVGALAGLLFGWLIIQYNFFQAVFVFVVAGIGWAAGKVFDGETDITRYIRRPEEEELE